MLDITVFTVCIACASAPLLPIVNAADSGPLVESGASVDQRVTAGGTISHPLNGAFGAGRSGIVNGSIDWDVYSATNDGVKLLISTDRDPAMRDGRNDIDVPDYSSSLGTWSVEGDERRFGFSAVNGMALSRFDDGRKWRGLTGRRSIEVGRRNGPSPLIRTTVKLRAEFEQSLPSGARPTANIRATVVPNL